MIKLFPFILLFIGGCVLTVGDLLMDKWVVSHKTSFYVLGMSIYVIGLNFLAQSFKYQDIAVASVIFVAFNVITLSIVGWIYFKEDLSSWEIFGIVLGLISIVILETFNSSHKNV